MLKIITRRRCSPTSTIKVRHSISYAGRRISQSASVTPNRHSPVDIDDWELNDAYHSKFLIPTDTALDFALANCESHGMPRLAVSVSQGKFLSLLAQSIRARRILEVGTLGGYSTIWLARALPVDGEIVTLEVDQGYAKVANQNLSNARLKCKVSVKVGPAVESLERMQPDLPFDLVFIDADKQNNLPYFLHAKRLVKSGGVIIVDNVVWHGRVPLQKYDNDADVQGIRKLLHHLAGDQDVSCTTLSMVGPKGYDGLLPPNEEHYLALASFKDLNGLGWTFDLAGSLIGCLISVLEFIGRHTPYLAFIDKRQLPGLPFEV